MQIEGRSNNGKESKVYLFYDHKVIGIVDQVHREEGMAYFLDTIFTPNPDAHIICAEVNARKEREEAFDADFYLS